MKVPLPVTVDLSVVSAVTAHSTLYPVSQPVIEAASKLVR